MSAAASATARGARRRYEIAGIDVEIRAAAPFVRGLDEIFAYFGFRPQRAAAGAAALQLVFRAGTAGVAIPADASEEARFGGVAVWDAGRRLYLDAPAGRARLDLDAGRCEATIDPAAWGAPGRLEDDPVTFLVLALTLLLRHQNRFGLHAAALADGEIGYLLVADGHCGKSTLSLQLVARGWSYVTDDFAFLRPCERGIEASGLRRNLCMDRAASARFEALRGRWRDRPFAGSTKRWLDMDEAFPGRTRSSCVPRILLFPRLVDSEVSELEPLENKAEILGRLMHESKLLVLEPAMTGRHLEVLRNLLLQCRSFHLRAGRDLVGDPARAAQLLATAVDRPGSRQ